MLVGVTASMSFSAAPCSLGSSQFYSDNPSSCSCPTTCPGWCIPTTSLTIINLRFDANEKCIYLNVAEQSTWFLRYTYTNSGNSLDEAKGLFAELMFIKSNGLKISGFHVNSYASSGTLDLVQFNAITSSN
jgi:hypothetical protein